MRVKVCFMCREYVPLLEDNYINKEKLEKFDSLHSGHPIQVIDKEELKKISLWKELLKKNSC